VDLSKQLLGFAEKEIVNTKNIRYTLLCDDVTHFITGCKQEEFDIII
jgi:23S rRNA G2069 N7-methylase RlmK/C1962 C5-methylase RlmI